MYLIMKTKVSIKTKIILSFFAILLIYVGTIIVLNNTVLENYYVNSRINALHLSLSDVRPIVDDLDVNNTEELRGPVIKVEEDYNVSISVYYPDERPAIGFMNNKEPLRVIISRNMNTVPNIPLENILTEEGQVIDLSQENRDFKGLIAKVLNDEGELKGFVLITTPVQSINDSINVFNKFALYTGLSLLIVALAIALFLANKITKPIREVTEVAKDISELNFSRKVEVHTNDETSDLANSINKMSNEMERTINELKVANAQLEKDIELKDNIDKMRREFISSVSHELKTPISLISGYSEALMLPDLDKENTEFYSSVIIDEASKMNKLVNNLLKLTQIDTGFVSMNLEDFHIVDLLNQIINNYQIKIDETKAKIEIKVEDLEVNADYDMTEIILNNFISNAFHHLEGENIIAITSSKHNNKLRITVKNTGKPIPEESIPHIWESFYKVDKARTRAYGGSGLGLSIVETIMKSYGNEYGVFNNEDGVSFYFDLNIKK